MPQNAIPQAITTTSNLDRKRSLVMTGACNANAWMWVSLCAINNVQCVWMFGFISGREESYTLLLKTAIGRQATGSMVNLKYPHPLTSACNGN